MTIATLEFITTMQSQVFTGTFDEKPLPPISYGQAGFRQPDKFSLKINRSTDERDNKTKEYISYNLKLISSKTEWNVFIADFSYPSQGTVSSYDYGHGYGGYLQEVAPDILKAVTIATGFDLETLVEEILGKK